MAQTVIAAFNQFLADKVNLDPEDTKTARASRDWLFERVASFQADTRFPRSYSEHDIHYGSFARRTKVRPLDDIDLMICLHAQGASYADNGGPISITVTPESNLKALCNDHTNTLNSTRVINKFVAKCADVPQYSKAEIKRNGVAAVLSLKSYDWAFDIVPCFMTVVESSGRSYYLIPDGQGNWKKTDPRIDRARTQTLNQAHDGHLLNVLRVIKYWNKRPTMPSISSYVVESMILDYYETRSASEKASQFVDLEIPRVLEYIASHIYHQVNDPKSIQGDINDLSWDEKIKISNRATADRQEAVEARRLEGAGDHKGSIQHWQRIFGSEFPRYE